MSVCISSITIYTSLCSKSGNKFDCADIFFDDLLVKLDSLRFSYSILDHSSHPQGSQTADNGGRVS